LNNKKDSNKKIFLVKALHVYGDYNWMATIRTIVRQIYKEGTKKGFPLPIKMRFVPNIAAP
jgi:hypothetical protein